MSDPQHRTRTLWLVGVLHAYNHLYMVVLVPLYLPIQAGFQLERVGAATLLVTVMMTAYFVPSFLMGILADRWSHKLLLGLGLLVNALGMIGLAWAPTYPVALACVAVAGLGGSLYHPAATALVARLFPVNTGRALGLSGIGSSAGFFVGPLYSGWRAAQTGNWRTPVLEVGLVGLVAVGLFFWLAREETPVASAETPAPPSPPMFSTTALWGFFFAACFCFSLRDFAGGSMSSLGSLFLQHAHGWNVRETGAALSWISLASAISNPLFGHFSDRGRKRWTCLVLGVAACLVAIFPRVPSGWVVPTFLVYGFFFMASYPMVEAALMEAVPDAVRGRVFGLFITGGGLVGNLAHWHAGYWVDKLGDKARSPAGYYPAYTGLVVLIVLSLAGLPCLHAIRKRESKP